ncbi:MAG: GTPase ObgE [Synergistaceae bacterium]|nr:GTPase ObgE [Synergistaceae bacterium]
MKFVDYITISVTAGRGGNGCMSFLHEPFKPNGGPDGGNGGRGGNIVFEAVNNLQTLADLEYKRHIKGANGSHGSGNARNGANGEDVVIPVPCGTVFYDAETGEGLADLVEAGDRFVAARGGRGGRGNRYFASSRRRAPRFCEKGDMGEEITLRLELKLIADIALVGLPNAGKSSILAAISNAQPKIADYPFTTLSPNLGVVNTGIERVVLADVPGLIEGAHENKGLGLEFLRHIDRSRLLIHVLDVSSGDFDSIINDFQTIRSELEAYDKELGKRPYFVAANKCDMLGADKEDILEKLKKYFGRFDIKVCPLSAATGDNISELTRYIIAFANKHPRPHSEVRLYAVAEKLPEQFPARGANKVQIIAMHGGGYRVLHRGLEKAAERFDFTQEENIARFTKLLRKYRIEQLLETAGAVKGDIIVIGYSEFAFYPDYYPNAKDEEDD